jgi:hypothetical protein
MAARTIVQPSLPFRYRAVAVDAALLQLKHHAVRLCAAHAGKAFKV